MSYSEEYYEILNLPISIRTKNLILRSGIRTKKQLYERLLKNSFFEIKGFGPQSQKDLEELLYSGLLNSIIDNDGKNIKPTESNLNKDLSLGDLVNILFSKFSDRELSIFVMRNLCGCTLQNVADKYNVTRERIRQIEKKANRKLISAVLREAFYINKFIKIAKELKEELTLSRWEEKLKEKQLLDETYSSYILDFQGWRPFQLFLYILLLIEKENLQKIKIEVPEHIDNLIRLNRWDLNFEESQVLLEISKEIKRTIKKKIKSTGGISTSELKKIFKNNNYEIIKTIMLDLGWYAIDKEWFTFRDKDQIIQQNPIFSACIKILYMCNPIKLDDLIDGVRRHISRFYPATSPTNVMKYVLINLGFDIKEDQVFYSGSINNILSGGENAFVSLIHENGNLLSLYEIAKGFIEKGFSLPLASRIAKLSPIVEKIEYKHHVFYKLRGIDLLWEDYENALSRNTRLDYDTKIVFSMDASITYISKIRGMSSLTGVLPINKLPNLGDGWKILVNNNNFGLLDVEYPYMWGLKKAFDHIKVQDGDTIKLIFSTLSKTVDVFKEI